jgi:hypothetical protein
MQLPSGWEEIERKSVGPFVTARVLRRPDGRQLEFSAWRHRKGYGLVDRDDTPRARRVEWWAPDRRGWWIAVLFMVGSACFALGSLPPAAAALGSAAAWVFFIGSIFFTSAAYLQFYEAANEGDDLEGRGRTRRPFGIRSHSMGWWAAATQLVGTVAFNVSTFAGTRDLTTQQGERLIWAPDVVGSILFLIASALVIMETHDRIRGILFRSLESRIAGLNMLGSIAFGISAVGAFIVPSTGELLSLPLVNLFTFIGAACFFVGAALLIPDLDPEPAAGPGLPG